MYLASLIRRVFYFGLAVAVVALPFFVSPPHHRWRWWILGALGVLRLNWMAWRPFTFPWWLAWGLRPLAVLKIRSGCTRFDCDTCHVFNGCPRWRRPHK
jgi:hypothetical protein